MLTRITDPQSLRRRAERIRASGLTLGLVPTMGALHAGHRSLIQRACAECDRTAVSIFVNPTQFGPGEDYERYPRSLEADLEVCAAVGVDVVYTPSVDAVYPPGSVTGVTVSGALTHTLEGAIRPGHFDGVATMVAKLLVAVRPDRAYFGHKDAQQCAVVRRLAADLDFGTEIVVCATVRDPDSLALSSRNVYLDREARRQALAIPAALASAHALHRAGETVSERLIQAAMRRLADSPDLAVDYVAVVHPDSFAPVSAAVDRSEMLIAARIAGTRLIDAVTLGADAGLVVGDLEITPLTP
ncbi:MAG: pantoate--beta-alanine ligase [Candidatus Dormiibacterota bacterium]